MRRHPWIKFYPTDWRGDAGLRGCSLAARGLWMDMLSLMHEAEPYGHLIVNGRVPNDAQLAGMLGASTKEVSRLLSELESAGVFSRSEDGVIYSRRMLRDRDRDERDYQVGKEGGNPEIRRGTVPKEQRVRPFRRADAPAKTERIFAKSNGRCHWCGTVLDRENWGPAFFHVDHVIPVCDGGTNEESNLVAACAACNHARALTGWVPTATQGLVSENGENTAEQQKPSPQSEFSHCINEKMLHRSEDSIVSCFHAGDCGKESVSRCNVEETDGSDSNPPLVSETIPTLTQKISDSNAQYQKPDTRYQKPERKNRSLRSLSRACAREADFAEWWAEYPRKVGKDAASKAYEKAVTRCSAAELLLALRRQRWPADPGFIPHPATWLNQGRWQDDPAAAAPDRPKAWRDMTAAEKDADLMARWGDDEPAAEPTPFPMIDGRLH